VRVLLVLCALAIAVAGCGSGETRTRAETARSPGPANFTLYVSNQSFERPTIDIRVEIDGTVVANDEFEVENQHNWVEFRLPLSRGRHVVRATSARGEAELRRTFRVKGKRWAVLDYWCCDDAADPRFTFDLSKRPIAFA
jgi:hypothetical protein